MEQKTYEVPIMSQQRFGDLTGLSRGTVRGMCEKGHLPTVKLGKRRLINVRLLNKMMENES